MDKNSHLLIFVRNLKDLSIRFWEYRFIRFLLVGGINTLFGYSVYAILILLDVHYGLSLFIAHVLGVLFNFNTTGRIVFHSNDKRKLFMFFGVYGVTYLTNFGALRIFDLLDWNMLLAQLVMILPMATLGYILNKTLVFK